jgi:hypothetical protein
VTFHKQWRWVGAFSDDVLLCAARARVGVAHVAWWAVWDRRARMLHEGTHRSWRGVSVTPVTAAVPGRLALTLSPGRSIEAVTGRMWTRKTPVHVTGTVLGRPFAAPGLLDESAGFHPRETAWLWSAGAGVSEAGDDVLWNLVDGLHGAGECTVWVAGEPHAVDVQRFEALRAVGGLAFTSEATRARRENFIVIASDYEQPFGTFAGELPVAGRLRGYGVMERHEARW